MRMGDNDLLATYVADTLRQASQGRCPIHGVRSGETYLLNRGVLKVPVVVDGCNGVTTAVFAYADETSYTPMAFAAIAEALCADGRPYPVFYSPAPLAVQQLKNVPLDSLHASYLQPVGVVPPGQYAMWWPSQHDGGDDSGAFADIDRTLAALDGIEMDGLGHFLYEWGIAGARERVALPRDPLQIYLEGPQGMPLVFSASEEKGLRFHLPVSSEGSTYRKWFWRHLARAMEQFRETVPGVPAVSSSQGRAWWGLAKEAHRSARANGGEASFLGGVVVGEERRVEP